MAKLTKKIGWQKYEDVIESQLTSPLFASLMESYISSQEAQLEKQIEQMEAEYGEEIFQEVNQHTNFDESELIQHQVVPFSKEMLEDMAMSANFDCWVGHCNFDITPRIKEILDNTDGIEVLKVCSRYRFFIGVGKMFQFKNVRKKLEKTLLT